MRRVTFALLCLFVFSVPWENYIEVIPLIGRMSRLIGLAAAGAGMLTLVITGRFRKPTSVVMLASLFVLLNFLSLSWTISYDDSIKRVTTYAQLVAMTWLITEFARERRQQESLMIAYCLGGYVNVADMVRRVFTQQFAIIDTEAQRYAANNMNANDLAVSLAIGMPIAWYLFLSRRGILRFVGLAYVPLASVAVLLTASRAGFLAALICWLMIPLTVARRAMPWMAMAMLSCAIVAVGVVPESNWSRVLGSGEELAGGTMSGRTEIWKAGWRGFVERPILGAGSGTFAAVVAPSYEHVGRSVISHNVFLAILVEQGVVGFAAFGALLSVCALVIPLFRPLDRWLWISTGLMWLVGAMTLTWQFHKITWLMFGLLAAHAGLSATAGGVSSTRRIPQPPARVPRVIKEDGTEAFA